MEIGKKWREYMIAGVVCIGQICCMMILCWSSPVIPKLADPKQSPLGRPLTPEEISWIGSLPLLGGVVGPFLGSYLAGKLGRKGGTLTTCALMMLGLLILTTGKHILMIYLARFLGGVGFGLLFTITLLYVSEIASDEVRGALVSFLHIFGMLGTLSIFTVGPFLSYNHVNYFCIVCLMIFFVAFFFMPETPLFFLTRGNYPAASRSLEFIRGKTAVGVTHELTQLERDLQATNKAKGHLEDLWTTRSNQKAMFIAFSLMALQQLAGIDIIIVYLMSVFEAARTDVRPEIASITVGAVQVLASCITPLVVDRLGRKPLLMISSLGMAVCWGLFGMFFKLKAIESPWAEKIWFLPLLLLILFMILYCTGFGPVPYVIVGEIFPFNVKDFASAIAVSLNWMVAFAMTKCFGGLVESLGMHNTFWIYGVLCVFAFLFTAIFVPETKGKSLQEIQDLMDKRRISKRMLKDQEQTVELMDMKSASAA